VSWSVHDAIEFEKRGKPSVVVASTEFHTLGQAEKKTLGMPDLRFAVVPHPFGALKRDAVRRYAATTFEQVVAGLTK